MFRTPSRCTTRGTPTPWPARSRSPTTSKPAATHRDTRKPTRCSWRRRRKPGVVAALGVDPPTAAFGARDAHQHLAVGFCGATATVNVPAEHLDLAGPAETLPAGMCRRRFSVEHDVERRPVGGNVEHPLGTR